MSSCNVVEPTAVPAVFCKANIIKTDTPSDSEDLSSSQTPRTITQSAPQQILATPPARCENPTITDHGIDESSTEVVDELNGDESGLGLMNLSPPQYSFYTSSMHC